jgi:DNA-directed RNA polymerase specialized sigma24 family protein
MLKHVDLEFEERRLRKTARKRKLTYHDISPIVEYVAAVKSSKFGEIGIYSADDVAQEIRAKCYRILHKFNPKEGTAFNFFGSCADNMLRDLRRKHTLRKTNVCYRCVYNRHGNCFLYGKDPERCERYVIYLENKRRKESVAKMLCDPDFAWHAQQSDSFMFDHEEYYEAAITQIRAALPTTMVHPFDMFMANSGVAPEVEDELFHEVKSVIKNCVDW